MYFVFEKKAVRKIGNEDQYKWVSHNIIVPITTTNQFQLEDHPRQFQLPLILLDMLHWKKYLVKAPLEAKKRKCTHETRC